jgi:hypothetical protein
VKLNSLIGIAAAAAMLPAAALATTVVPSGPNQYLISYDNVGSDVDLGPLNLSEGPVGIGTAFAVPDVDGSLTFSIFGDPALLSAEGSLDVNIILGAGATETFTGSFDGNPLVFIPTDGDFVASFSTTFAGPDDVKVFFFDFAGFDSGDQFQVNVSGVSGVIPLPSSVFMLLAGLGGLGVISRRRKTAMA